MMEERANGEFGFWRRLLWPVRAEETLKVGLLFGLLFFLCMSYSVMRNMKDTLLLTAGGAGAEALPFLKVWGMLPGALIATWIVTQLSKRCSRKGRFFRILGFYTLYYLLFAFILFPMRDQLVLSSFGATLTQLLPAGCKGLIAIIANWNISIFYVVTELWGSVVLAILFWGWANELFSIDEAKRTYGILNLSSNVAPLFGALTASLIAAPWLTSILEVDRWEGTLMQVTLLVCSFCCIAMVLFYRLCKLFPGKAAEVIQGSDEKKRPIGVRTALRLLAKDPYLLSIATVVIGYNVTINLTDLMWKDQLHRALKDPILILEHMNLITMGIGVFATIGALAFAAMMRRCGWTFVAMITPIVMASLGITFFSLRLGYAPHIAFLGLTPALLALYCGSLQNCLSKACKYSVFDATKEMTFLPLDSNTRSIAKSAIDGLGSSVGKSGASVLSQGFIVLCGGLAASTPWIGCTVMVVLVAWIFATLKLGRAVEEKQASYTATETTS